MATAAVLDLARLHQAKFAYTTRPVRREALATLLTGDYRPRMGDLLLARVAQIGQHKRIESIDGCLRQLFPDDEIVVSYGHRYAPDQYEAEIPDDLSPCHLVAGGGVASRVLSRHAIMTAATVIEPIGLLGNRQGQVVNLRDFALPPLVHNGSRPLTIAVVGTSMNAGKTTTAAYAIRGLVRAGYRVGAAKVTGTGAGKDIWFMRDAGADPVLDFTAAGYPSTYRATPAEILGIFDLLSDHLAASGAEVIVLEVADGLFQAETAALLESPAFAAGIDGVFFAAGEAMAASSGVTWLRDRGLRVLGVSGVLSASPLAIREAAATIDAPVLTLDELGDPSILEAIGSRALAA